LKTEDIKRIGVAGAGIMGAGIAQEFANAGYEVVVYDLKEEFLTKGREAIANNQATFIAEGLLTEQKAAAARAKITFSTNIEDLRDASLVIEAIVEKLPIKQDFLGKSQQDGQRRRYFGHEHLGPQCNGDWRESSPTRAFCWDALVESAAYRPVGGSY
jgi:3-hydroxybutyryl-CoA dehydrogenase